MRHIVYGALHDVSDMLPSRATSVGFGMSTSQKRLGYSAKSDRRYTSVERHGGPQRLLVLAPRVWRILTKQPNRGRNTESTLDCLRCDVCWTL